MNQPTPPFRPRLSEDYRTATGTSPNGLATPPVKPLPAMNLGRPQPANVWQPPTAAAMPAVQVPMQRGASLPAQPGPQPAVNPDFNSLDPNYDANQRAYQASTVGMGQPAISLGNYQGGAAPAPTGGGSPQTGITDWWKGADKMGMANAGLGIAGTVMALSAKRPDVPKPGTFNSVIPQQNYEDDRARAYNGVAQNQAQGVQQLRQQAGADGGSFIAGVLGLNNQSNQARTAVDAGIGTQKREDTIRQADTMNQDAKFNFGNQQQYQQQVYEQGSQKFQDRRNMGMGMASSALQYANAQMADNKNYAESVKTQDNKMTQTGFELALKGARTQQDVDAIYSRFNFKLPK